MPSLVLENVPLTLFDQIQRLAVARKRTLADTVLEVLETAFRSAAPTFSEPPPASEIFASPEILAPFDIPWPEGKPVRAIRVAPPLPTAHDLPDPE